jgi:hypothetical protein
MEEILKLWPFILGLAINIVAITLAFAKVRQDIAVLQNTVDEGVKERMGEIENRHEELKIEVTKQTDKIADIDKKLFAHLATHK